jgi:hypothetical protein
MLCCFMLCHAVPCRYTWRRGSVPMWWTVNIRNGCVSCYAMLSHAMLSHAMLCRYTWRHGSVPMWWTVNISNGGMGEAEIKISCCNMLCLMLCCAVQVHVAARQRAYVVDCQHPQRRHGRS